jgi:hypothetical protein
MGMSFYYVLISVQAGSSISLLMSRRRSATRLPQLQTHRPIPGSGKMWLLRSGHLSAESQQLQRS